MNPGVVFALVALVAWGLDDFFIGRTTRRFGDAAALFFVAIFGALMLLPLVWTDISTLEFWQQNRTLIILSLTACITLIAALADYEALRLGKLSIVDPVYALEIPVTFLFGWIFVGELLGAPQIILIFLLTVGVVLVSSKHLRFWSSFSWEKGVKFALLSVLFMGVTNFLTGYSGRLTNAFVANWFVYAGLALAMFVYLILSHGLKPAIGNLRKSPCTILALSISDVVAWTAFTYSATLIPIALATGISEAYIAFAALLGLWFNNEKLQRHQCIGISVVVISAIILAVQL